MVRAIQTGVGWWGMNWIKSFAPAVPEVEMVGFVARSVKSRAGLAAAGIAPALIFPTLAEAAHATGAELLINATRTEAHRAVIGEALSLGLHVLTEKPFAATVAEAKELIALAAANDRLLMIAENYRFTPAPITVAELTRQGKFGAPTLLTVDFRMHIKTMGFDYPYPELADPILADLAIHFFELMRMVLHDEPRRVMARSWNLPGNAMAGKPATVAIVEFERGTLARMDASYLSSGAPTSWGGEWRLDCADGEIWWSARDGTDRVLLRPLGGAQEAVELPPLAMSDSAATLHAMASAITIGTIPPDAVTGADNLNSLAMSEAAILSAARRGEWVDIAEVLA
jgi:predicted dehydrogenase